jgi:hypothetical protein
LVKNKGTVDLNRPEMPDKKLSFSIRDGKAAFNDLCNEILSRLYDKNAICQVASKLLSQTWISNIASDEISQNLLPTRKKNSFMVK